MDEGKIKYGDIISPDDSIKNLIGQLESLNESYKEMINAVKAGAKSVVDQMKSMSTATSEGRAEIDDATAAANRLQRAQKELKFALSDTGKEVAWLKSQVASQNKMSAEEQRAAEALVGSYNSIKLQIKDLTREYKALSAADRAGAKGEGMLNELIGKKQQLAALDDQMRLHIQTLSAVEKAQQKLNFLRSEEGQQLIELKRAIAEEIAAHKSRENSINEVDQAFLRLRAAQDESRVRMYEYNLQAKEANKISKLQAQINLSEEGSYNRLSAQYALNKIQLNAMSEAERKATESGKQLEAETAAIYQRMIELQEATGNHRLSVGHYSKAWDGLGVAVSQVVRELPAAAVSLNTFFLGISNNIPIVIDEINKLREANKLAIAQGKPAESVTKKIVSALLSWNSVLVIGLTVLSSHGKQIIDWISKMVKGQSAIKTTNELLQNMTKEMETTTGSYGQNIVTVQRLSREWQELSSKKEQLKWIRDNKTEFDKLNISIKDVNDAENAFVRNTDNMIAALTERAKAAAAVKLAADKYEEALRKRMEAEQEEYNFERIVDPKTGKVTIKKTKKTNLEKANWWDMIKGGLSQGRGSAWGSVGYTPLSDTETVAGRSADQRIKEMYEEADAAEAEADAYFQLSEAYNQNADAIMRRAKIRKKERPEPRQKADRPKKHKPDPKETEKQQRDLTDVIWRNDLQIRKKYELSISALQRNEFEKRKIEAIDSANAAIREMQEKFRKNEVYMANPEGKFKPLTDEQKKQIEEQQKEIQAFIENTQRKLEIDLQHIEGERMVDSSKKLRQAMEFRIETIAKSLEEEKKLRVKQLEEEESLYSSAGHINKEGDVVITGSLTPEQIADMQRRRQQIIAEYDRLIYRMRENDINAQIELVKKGTEEELELLMRQNEIARQLALIENRAKPIEERQDEAQINAQYDKRGSLIKGRTEMTNFDALQAQAEAEFNMIKHNETQITIFKLQAERDRWRKQIELAKQGALDWSDAQIKEAEAMITKLEREITEAGSFVNLVGEKGITGAILTRLGFNDEQIEAMTEATNIILENIKSIVDAEVEAAEKAVQAAQKRVEAAQSAYEAEIEGRNNGYANSVATAKKELQQEKRRQAQKQKILEEAQRRQQAIDTMTQASSLITASANIWSAFSKIPIVGPALAMAAIAAMWTSFAVAKVKAAQVTKQASQEYGEGGLEFLEGGSHASGNDIDLQTTNSKGRNMRAEGGEAMAIINRRNTRKYRRMLPEIVNSLNNGTFEDKFTGAFRTGDTLAQQVTYQTQSIDLSRIEEDVRALKRNTERRYYTNIDGTIIEIRKNVTRHIH